MALQNLRNSLRTVYARHGVVHLATPPTFSFEMAEFIIRADACAACLIRPLVVVLVVIFFFSS